MKVITSHWAQNPDVAVPSPHTNLSSSPVIHIVTDAQVGVSEIPLLLAGKSIPVKEHNIGTKNYSQPPVAVVAAGPYRDEDLNLMRDACKDVKAVPWLRPNMSRADDRPPLWNECAFGKCMAERAKRRLAELGVGGEEKEEWRNQVYMF
jgi:hypothetical protein